MTINTKQIQRLDLTDSTTHNDYSLLNKVQHRYSPSRRMRECMTKPIPDFQNNMVLSSSNIRGTKFIGLERCKSRWCPCCNKIEVSIQQGLMTMRHLQMIKNGYVPFFITLTQPRNSDIEKSNTDMGIYLKNWKRGIEHTYKQFGVKCKYMVSSKDITFDIERPKQIYHLHYHNLLYIPMNVFISEDKNVSLKALNGMIEEDKTDFGVKSKIEKFKSVCKDIWSRITGYKATKRGQDIQVAKNKDITTYIKKIESANNLTYEVISKSKTKTHNKDTLTWIGLLQYIAKTYDKKAIRIYREFLTFMKGKKLLNWGQGLKKLEIDEDIKQEVIENEENRDRMSKERENIKTFRITTALMRVISKMRIQGTICTMLDSSWNGENVYSNNMFEFLIDKSVVITESPSNIINEILLIKPYVLMWLQSLYQDTLINEDRYNELKAMIYK